MIRTGHGISVALFGYRCWYVRLVHLVVGLSMDTRHTGTDHVVLVVSV